MTTDQTAACAGHPEPLWDAVLEGEHELDRARRHTRALEFCRRCPIRTDCVAGIDLKHDDGIHGGIVLPTIPDKHRRSAYADGLLDHLLPAIRTTARLRRAS